MSGSKWRVSSSLALCAERLIAKTYCSIGSACARAFAAEGCDLALTYSSSKDAADELALTIKTAAEQSGNDKLTSQKVTVHHADMSQPYQVANMCEEVQKAHGRGVDILIPNAGMCIICSLHEPTLPFYMFSSWLTTLTAR